MMSDRTIYNEPKSSIMVTKGNGFLLEDKSVKKILKKYNVNELESVGLIKSITDVIL
jgi:Tfp pilus assembly protein PilP